MTKVTITEIKTESEMIPVTQNLESGWYIDSDGDLIFVLNKDDEENEGVFAIVINGESWNPGYTWLIKDEDFEEYLGAVDVKPLKNVKINYN